MKRLHVPAVSTTTVRLILAATIAVSHIAPGFSEESVRSVMYRSKNKQCHNYVLSSPHEASALPLLGITTNQFCDCVASTFVASLSDADIFRMGDEILAGASALPFYLRDRLTRTIPYCKAALMRPD